MKRLATFVCFATAAVAFLGVIMFKKVKVWVVPDVEVSITDQDGRAVEIEREEISVESDEIGDVTYEIQADGRIVIHPVKVWGHSFIGNPVYRTRITVAPKGFKRCEAVTGLSGGEVVGSLPAERYRVHFRLAEKGSDIESQTDEYGFRSDGSEYLMR